MNDRIRLLVADDEDIIRRRVSMMLRDTFHIEEARSAEETRERTPGTFDAILLDIMFPDGNGIDICREIKTADPHATVVISSSVETVDAWNQAFDAGADGYLEKRELLGLDPRKIILTIRSLTERNRLRRQAEETNRRQAELLSVLSHDVRAPFQALLGTIHLLKKSSIPPDAKENVETLSQCASDQLAFINSLLELMRLESGRIELRRARFDLNLPVNQCLQGLTIIAGEKEITIRRKQADDLPNVNGDPARIAQVVNNLISNAVKFTPRGGRVEVETRRAEKDGVAGAAIVVRDSGVGIRPEERDSLLNTFKRGRANGTEGEKGVGLGLSICRQIMSLHGGTLDLAPLDPRGTEVYAWFPALAETSEPPGEPLAGDRASDGRRPGGFDRVESPRFGC